MHHTIIQREDFDAGQWLRQLGERVKGTGALASFIGLVREDQKDDHRLVALELEHYPGMCERMISTIAHKAGARWDLHGWVVIHRIGRLRPGEQIVLAATAAAHRQAAFDACHFIMDWLKTDAPFWKQVHFADGSTSWIEAEERDRKERDSWG